MCKASSGTAQTSAPSAVTTELSLRLQGRTFGAPGLTARDVHASRREQPRESRAPGMAGRGGQGCRGLSPLRGGSFARVLRTHALRTLRLPRTAAPAPAAAGPRRNVPPVPRDANWSRPSASRQIRRSPGEGHSHPNAAHCPGRPPPAYGASRPRDARTRLRRAVDPGVSLPTQRA